MSLDPPLDVAKDWTPRQGDVDLDALEAAAKAATPGPWTLWSNNRISTHQYVKTEDDWTLVAADSGYTDRSSFDQRTRDLGYIAAANPQVVLALIERLRKAEEETRALRALVAVMDDLDRCEHGRHEGDVCSGVTGCDGPSLGNPIAANTCPTSRWKSAGRQIGFTIHRTPIVVPSRSAMRDPAAWKAEAPRCTDSWSEIGQVR